jgi:hypothetical protein
VNGTHPTSSPESSGDACVFVIGMHRSGTSAVAGMLTSLGVQGPSHDDLIPATLSNPRGHFESRTLTRVDNQLLHILGGTWSAPPTLDPGWEQGRAVAALRGRAAHTFASIFPTRPMAWKDPRNCIVLPFWQSVVEPPIAAVFVYRDGHEVAQSLRIRTHLSLTLGLALWERYLRTSCADLAGVPTFVTEYGRLLDEPTSSCGELVRFLADLGIAVGPDRVPAAIDSLDGRLRHERSPDGARPGITSDQGEVLAALRGLDGAHHPWQSPDLGTEPEWVEDVLSLRRDHEVLQRQLRSSRAGRVVEAWWKMRGARRPPPTVEGDEV